MIWDAPQKLSWRVQLRDEALPEDYVQSAADLARLTPDEKSAAGFLGGDRFRFNDLRGACMERNASGKGNKELLAGRLIRLTPLATVRQLNYMKDLIRKDERRKIDISDVLDTRSATAWISRIQGEDYYSRNSGYGQWREKKSW